MSRELKSDRHLRDSDPIMAKLIDDFGGPLSKEVSGTRRPSDVYGALIRSIVGQQLSVKAARTIWNRLLDYFDGTVPTPDQILAADPDSVRVAAGLSRAKMSYLRSLAEHIKTGALEIEQLTALPDETVIEELVAVKGIGEWTAHMFLMFTLQRPDVLPTSDLGIRNAAKHAYALTSLPNANELEQLAQPWRPYRTRACLYLWRSLDNEPN